MRSGRYPAPPILYCTITPGYLVFLYNIPRGHHPSPITWKDDQLSGHAIFNLWQPVEAELRMKWCQMRVPPDQRRLDNFRAKGFLNIFCITDIAKGNIAIDNPTAIHVIAKLVFLAIQCHWDIHEHNLALLFSSQPFQDKWVGRMKESNRNRMVHFATTTRYCLRAVNE